MSCFVFVFRTLIQLPCRSEKVPRKEKRFHVTMATSGRLSFGE